MKKHNEKISKKNKIIFAIGICLIAILLFLFYYLFCPKKYTFYIDENIGNVSAVRIDCDDYNKGGVYVYDKELVDELYKALEDVKIAPYYSTKISEEQKSFWIEFVGENELEMSMQAICDSEKKIYEVYLNVSNNGGCIQHPIWSFIGRFEMDEKTGDKLYELVRQRYHENVRNISVKDILELSKNKETEVYKFYQFQSDEITTLDEIYVDNSYTAYPKKFEIENKKGYIIAWCVNTIVNDGNSNKCYRYVHQAKVYNEKGEEIDFYDEGIEEFLEAME